jgi:hypothetical protein
MAEPALTSAPLPTVRAGDHWRFAVTGRLGGTRHEESRRVVAVTADRIVCEVESTDTQVARGRFFYTRQWNLLRRPAPVPAGASAEEIEAAGDWRWQPHYPQFDFPLLRGKLWRGTARTVNRATDTVNVHRYEARVLAARSVDTPAGRFAVLPVRYVADVATEGDEPPRLWRNEETLYYAPAANHFVRAEQRVVDPAGQPARDALHELLAYEPAA